MEIVLAVTGLIALGISIVALRPVFRDQRSPLDR